MGQEAGPEPIELSIALIFVSLIPTQTQPLQRERRFDPAHDPCSSWTAMSELAGGLGTTSRNILQSWEEYVLYWPLWGFSLALLHTGGT